MLYVDIDGCFWMKLSGSLRYFTAHACMGCDFPVLNPEFKK